MTEPLYDTQGYETGIALRRAVLGDAHVDRALDAASEFSGPWQDFLTTTAWGQIWGRPGLDRRTRSMLTVALLAAGRCEAELALHIRAAISNEVSAEEIREVLLHTAAYAGIPAASAAFAVAQRVLMDLGVEAAGTPYARHDPTQPAP